LIKLLWHTAMWRDHWGARYRLVEMPDDRRDRAGAPRRSRCFECRRGFLCAEVRGARRGLTAKCRSAKNLWARLGMRPLLTHTGTSAAARLNRARESAVTSARCKHRTQ